MAQPTLGGGVATDQPRGQPARPRRRPGARQGPDEAARRLRGDRRRCSSSSRVLGLRVLGQSNARVESLGTLQLRAATYQSLQTQAQQLRQLLAIRVAEDPNLNAYLGRQRLGVARRSELDRSSTRRSQPRCPSSGRRRTRRGSGSSRRRGRGCAASGSARDYRAVLERARRRSSRSTAPERPSKTSQPLLTDGDRRRQRARRADRPARGDDAATQTNALIAQNRSSYTASRNLFVGVGAGSVLLALLLGFVLSWSLDRPDPAHGGAARRDRRRRLLDARRGSQPRRARRARREPQPDERRAAAAVRGARDRQPAQVGVPRQHVARAAHAAERDHRLLRGARSSRCSAS